MLLLINILVVNLFNTVEELESSTKEENTDCQVEASKSWLVHTHEF